MTRKQRTYDQRLRELVQTTRDLQLATQHGMPASTARGWLNKPATEVVSLDVLDLDTLRLQHEVIQLRRRVTKPTALLHRYRDPKFGRDFGIANRAEVVFLRLELSLQCFHHTRINCKRKSRRTSTAVAPLFQQAVKATAPQAHVRTTCARSIQNNDSGLAENLAAYGV